MLGTVTKVVSGIGMLIMIYLFLSKPKATSSIINSLGTNSINGIKALQGR